MTAYLKDKLVEGSPRIYDLAASDCADLRNLYLTGEYVTDDETRSAQYIAGLPEEGDRPDRRHNNRGLQERIHKRRQEPCFEENVAVILHLGFERILSACILRFRGYGLRVILSAEVPTLFHSFSRGNMGYGGADPNPQYYYDHREDLALFLDEGLRTRRIEGLTNAYRKLRDKTVLYAGPAVLETFGSAPFCPAQTPYAPRYDEARQKNLHGLQH